MPDGRELARSRREHPHNLWPEKMARAVHCTGADILRAEVSMLFEKFSVGSIRIDGVTYEHDVVIDRGEVRKRKKKPSKNSPPTSGTHQSRQRKPYSGSVDSS